METKNLSDLLIPRKHQILKINRYIDPRQAITVTLQKGSGVFGIRDGHMTRLGEHPPLGPHLSVDYGIPASLDLYVSICLIFRLNLNLYMIPK